MGNDVIGVLPTGFGKSILFQLLADLMPRKVDGRREDQHNIVLIVCPLNSIMEDQINFLRRTGISCGTLRVSEEVQENEINAYKLFDDTQHDDEGFDDDVDFTLENIALGNDNSDEDDDGREEASSTEVELTDSDVIEGRCSLVFGHPEAFLSISGRRLLKSETYQTRVVAIAVDEAHCVEIW